MGLQQTRFHDALRRGDHGEVHSLYTTRKTVRDSVEPNSPLGPGHGGNSVLHYAALHGMAWLFRDLLARGGKPDMRNEDAGNSLHMVCGGSNRADIRQRILRLTLEEGLTGMDVKHVLREKDGDGNMALHLAASSGLTGCVELLLAHGADIYATNKKEHTAADCAAASKHTNIATLLETKMVFSAEDGANPAPPVEPDHTHLMELAEAPAGMKDSDLRSMKDQLLIETSELLGVSLFTSEALLRHHGWSKEQLLEAWMDNPADTCEKAGVQLPSNLGTHNLDVSEAGLHVEWGGGEGRGGEERGGEGEERECGVCVMPCGRDIVVPCGHFFCRDCWRQYLHLKIESGEAHSIMCQEYGCYKLVPLDVIEEVVSREMAQRYLKFDIAAFVDSHPTIRWCPHPNCRRAVRLTAPDSPGHAPQPTTVHCGNEHYFCWSCSGEPHVPCSCEMWQCWLDHVQEMGPRIGERTASQLENSASQRWLATRSKPCPKCKAPIEKTEGCNHICCKKCKHDFCWVCLDEWKQHNTSTGGYFECNRYEVRRKADGELQKRKEQIMEGMEEAEQMRRFMHYNERYKSHKESLQLELPFLEKAYHKTAALLSSVTQLDASRRATVSLPLDMSFIEEAIRELLAARRVLIASYAFGYYVEGNQARRMFENMQGTVEQVTELLAQVVARPHLRKPRGDIIRLTRECREKRVWLVKDCRTLPESTPPSRRRRHRRMLRMGRESDSSPDSSADDSTGILRLLEQVRTQPHQAELQRAMELSRREFEEQEQLQADIKKAKELSLQGPQTSQPASDCGLFFVGGSTRPEAQERPSKLSAGASFALSPFIPSQQTPELTMSPFSRPHRPSPPPSPLLSPFLVSPVSPAVQGAGQSSSSSSSQGGANGDWDEEEMARALSLSLMNSTPPPPPPPPPAPDTQDSRRGEGVWMSPEQLPPELRHLLEGSQRSGQNV